MVSRAISTDLFEVVHPAIAIPKAVALGTAWGVTGWAAYGTVEYFFYSIWPLLTHYSAIFPSLNWRISAMLLDLYWLLGAVSGVIAGAMAAWLAARSPRLRDSGAHTGRIPANLGMLAGVFASLALYSPTDRSAISVCVIASAVAVLSVWALARPTARLIGWAEIHPVLLAVMLLGPAWVSGDLIGSWTTIVLKRICVGLFVLALGGLHLWMGRFRPWGPTRHLLAVLGLLTALTVTGSVMSARHSAIPDALPVRASTASTPVILVTFDTTRADHMGAYGYSRKTTPNLEQFARGATLYTDAVAASDLTLTSHGSIFTGMYGSWHGARVQTIHPMTVRPLDPKVPTLAEMLSAKGYVTAGVAANHAFLTPDWGLSRGFDSFNVESVAPELPSHRRFMVRQGVRSALGGLIDTSNFDALYRTAAEIDEDVFETMRNRAFDGRPFFLFVNYMDAHAPYVAEPPAGSTIPRPSGPTFDYSRFRVIVYDYLASEKPLSAPLRDELMMRYDAGVASEDAGLGRLMQYLKDRGIYDKALIIVTADHGEGFGEHRVMEHGVGVYECQVHVPLVIKYPHQSEGRVVRAPVSHVDLLPTVLATLGYPVPAAVQGRSLLDPAALEGRTVMAESFPGLIRLPRFDRTQREVRKGSLKLIVSTDPKQKKMLFDLSTDPNEEHDLAAGGNSQANAMEAELREWLRGAPKTDHKAAADEELKRLKGLGYIQ